MIAVLVKEVINVRTVMQEYAKLRGIDCVLKKYLIHPSF